MKKSLIALAVAGAFAAPAFAATSNIDISGKIAADVTKVSGTTTGATNTTQVNNNNSAITISGNEDLGGGMKAFFSLTYGLPLASGGALTGQNQIAGVEGGFGKVFVGAFDNPLKVMGRGIDLFADQSTGDARQLTGTIGHVEARANDVIAYISPSMSGFQGVLAWTNNPIGAVATTNNGTLPMTIFKLAYANGPVSVAYGHHNIATSAAGADDESADRLVGSYKMGDLRLVGSWQSVKNGVTAPAADAKTWGLGASYGIGAITLKTQYYKHNDDRATMDSKMWVLGADYALSKRTTMQFAWSKVTNETGVNYGGSATVRGGAALGVAVANSDNIATAAGEDPTRISIGMKHTF